MLGALCAGTGGHRARRGRPRHGAAPGTPAGDDDRAQHRSERRVRAEVRVQQYHRLLQFQILPGGEQPQQGRVHQLEQHHRQALRHVAADERAAPGRVRPGSAFLIPVTDGGAGVLRSLVRC